MRRVIVLTTWLTLCAASYAQFGSPRDLAFWGKQDRATTCQVSNITGLAYWWVDSDLANGAVTVWTDRVHSVAAFQSDAAHRPVKSASGIRFNGDEWLSVTNGISFGSTNDPFLIIVNLDSESGGSQRAIICEEGGAGDGVFKFTSDEWYMRTSPGTLAVMKTGALVDLITTMTSTSTNTYYTNGITVASAGGYSTIGDGSGGMEFGARSGALNKLFGYIREIAVWTNVVFTPAQVAAVHCYATNRLGYSP